MPAEAIGIIEIRGILSSIEAVESMLKFTGISLIKEERIPGGMSAVMLKGDIDTLRNAINTGMAAAKRTGEVISIHVIPKPQPEDNLDFFMISKLK